MRIMAVALFLLAAGACQRTEPSEETRAATSRVPDRLMPRRHEQRERVDQAGGERIRCSKPVPSIPC